VWCPMDRSPSPPPPPTYLERPYPSTQKGGTLIVAEVTDLATHARRLCTAGGYRPARCPRCGHGVLHVHDYRWRVLRGDPAGAGLTVVRYRCAAAACRARWLLLPGLLARCLWRRWEVVAAATTGTRPASWPRVPARTVRRWQARLGLAARGLGQVLASSGAPVLEQVATRLGLAANRRQLVQGLALPLGAVAALLHRLVPGVRLL
jgi:hypothetical protein